MQQVNPPRRDPAPSRIAYRMNRLWLTPSFRIALRYGLPFGIVALVVVGYFASPDRRAAIVAQYDSVKHSIEQRPEFMVTMMSIDGASLGLSDAIRQMLAVPFPISCFYLNLDQMRNQIETLDAVASADLRVGTGGVLQVTIHARKPVVVWRARNALLLLDVTGHRVAGLEARDARADLPLIAGGGAEEAVPQALQILTAAAPLQSRIRGLVLIGARRWDLVLDRDQRIMLPEKNPVQALERVIALNDAQDLLSCDVTVVDMRLANRPTLRLTPAAFAARQQALGLDQGAKKSR